MSVSYIVRTSKKDEKKSKKDVKESSLSIKVQKTYRDLEDLDEKGNPKIKFTTNILLAVPKYKVNVEEWRKHHKEAKYRKEHSKMFEVLDEVEKAINDNLSINPSLTSEEVKNIINDKVFKKEIEESEKAAKQKKLQAEEERKRLEEANRMTLNKYIDKYVQGMKSGERQTPEGGRYAYNSIKSTKQSFTKLKEYQKHIGKEIDFDDINMNFYRGFSAFLQEQDYSINTIGKCFKDIKSVMEASFSDKLHTNIEFRDKKFRAKKVEVDSIYLTEEDLQKIQDADLSSLPKCYDEARDIFMVGVWTAQRVSDYNNISKDQIKTSKMQVIEDGRIVDRELMTIDIKQQKTGHKVSIPVNSQLKAILEKYDYNLPHLWDQKINDYIKEVGRIAGLDEEIEITSTKGGQEHKETHPKYSLIHTHTARRTGATLMYLSGMDIFDICKITGHSSPVMLKKYIKADSLEVAEKIADKYEYFK